MSDPPSAVRTVAEERANPPAIHLLFAFIAGFIAVLGIDQSLRAALVAAGALSGTPYSLAPAAVTGVPKVLAKAFWGGVWGIVLALVASRVPRRPAYAFWIAALAVGALLPSFFAWFIVAPLMDRPLAAGGDPVRLGVTLVTNGAWGVGTAALYRFLRGVWSR